MRLVFPDQVFLPDVGLSCNNRSPPKAPPTGLLITTWMVPPPKASPTGLLITTWMVPPTIYVVINGSPWINYDDMDGLSLQWVVHPRIAYIILTDVWLTFRIIYVALQEYLMSVAAYSTSLPDRIFCGPPLILLIEPT